MGKRIIISVSNDLVTDQRVLKVSETLFRNGFDLCLVGRKLKSSPSVNLPFSHKRFNLLFNSGFMFYLELNIRLFIFLLFSKAEIFYSNDTDTLPANFLASKIRNKQLVFDAHELFPEVPELQDRPFIKSVWRLIENLIFPHLQVTFTVCDSIADYYSKKYNIKMHVVRNVPNFEEKTATKKLHFDQQKIILYQGALNIGRGLEWVIDAMPHVENAVLYIIGDGDIREQLEHKVKIMHLESRVIFHGKVAGKELQSFTSSGDIGLCLLENKGLSYYYSLPNRIFSYLHAGVPVLASPFPEIARIVEKYKTGVLTNDYTPPKLAATINEMLQNPIDTSQFDVIKKEFCWEEEEKIILSLIKSI